NDTLSSTASTPTFAELFEINDLKAQAQAKDTVILNLKEKLNSLNGDVKDRDVIRKVEESETLNIELGHQAVEQHCVKKNKFQDKMKDVLKENERLLEQAISTDIVNIVVNANVNYACKTANECERCVIIETEL
nr:hypothetical protein [Tanacetum cinerariifolium]